MAYMFAGLLPSKSDIVAAGGERAAIKAAAVKAAQAAADKKLALQRARAVAQTASDAKSLVLDVKTGLPITSPGDAVVDTPPSVKAESVPVDASTGDKVTSPGDVSLIARKVVPKGVSPLMIGGVLVGAFLLLRK
jgi:hypothetical protein